MTGRAARQNCSFPGLSPAGSLGEMQAEVDFLGYSINQWPNSISSVKAALSPSLPCYKEP